MFGRLSRRFRKGNSRNGECVIPIEEILGRQERQEDSIQTRYNRAGESTLQLEYDFPLLQAVGEQDYEKCKSLIEEGVDINYRDYRSGSSALHIAVKQGNTQILKILLENGADCNLQDDSEQAPIHYATHKDHYQNFQLLLNQESLNINIKNRVHDTPLHISAREGRDEICTLVLAHPNVQVNYANKKGMTPLHIAAQENRVKILRLLLDSGANIERRDNNSFLPFHHAAIKGYYEVSEILLSHKDNAYREKQLTSRLKDGKIPIMLSAKHGHHRSCKLMEFQNINFCDKDGNTALHHAVTGGFESTVSTLVEMGVDVNTKNKKGVAPIHAAAAKKRNAILQILANNGANLHSRDKQGRTVFHYSVDKNSLETLTMLLEDPTLSDLIDQKDEKDCTPLNLAIKKESIESALLLLEKGASPVISCNVGMSPLHLAADQGCTRLCEVLLANKDVDVNLENEHGVAPIHLAALHGSLDVIQMLVRKKAKLTAVDKNGRTALHIAASVGSVSIVKFLAKKGVPLKIKDEKGSCALHLAAFKGSLECCKVLISCAKSSSWEKDHSGKLPLDNAFKDSDSIMREADRIHHDRVFQYLLHNISFRDDKEVIQRIRQYMDVAVLMDRPIILDAIVNSSWWYYGISRENGKSLHFQKLIADYPELALKLMDHCIINSDGPDSGVTYDFRLLEENYYIPSDEGGTDESPFNSKTNKIKPNAREYTEDGVEWKNDHPLTAMVSHQRLNLLLHPLISMWLLQKWTSYICIIVLGHLMLELLFTASITLYMGVVDNWYHIQRRCNLSMKEICLVNDQNLSTASLQDPMENCSYSLILKKSCWAVLFLITGIIMAKELYTWWRLKRAYLSYVEHKIRIVRMFFTLFILTDFNACEHKIMVLEVWRWEIGIVALLLTWLHSLNTLNQIPKFSIFMPVTTRFIKSFLMVLMYIFSIMFVFAFIFHLLLGNQPAFSSMGEAMIKTTLWMLQDLAYDNTFIFNKDYPLQYPLLIKCVFLVFVTFLGGFIANFIITQPSNQFDIFRERACFHRAACRVELFFKYDICFPYYRRAKAKVRMTESEAKKSFYEIFMTKLLMIDPKEEAKPVSQLDLVQKDVKDINEQILSLIAINNKYLEEIDDLKQQVTILSKTIIK
ncbi:transient receptor potential cation channel subfamily A member 1 homolog [Palaemon carinicauda]|uniref:transient receptor potential cation channel subfamily A member 1 homolog n=1 Tax=Palaemon carinicauda TaxID=392227 RepID=UPI0035B5B86C